MGGKAVEPELWLNLDGDQSPMSIALLRHLVTPDSQDKYVPASLLTIMHTHETAYTACLSVGENFRLGLVLQKSLPK